ncbi:MAG: aminotransferase class I/II-fold pyridoxal phosphate-dependent enzyme [Luteitalea sp.]|nr:aminotransferase class I/II-fold pyridoxal phosphate-dependent enzyme [Luteitalea sp.]
MPLSDLDYGPEEEAAILRVLRSRWLSMGPEVQAFEAEMARFLGVEHAFAVSSGTAALHLACLALGIGPGDEVIQPAINFVAAANTTVAVGATPVFADILGLDEPTIDPEAIERLLTPRTRAVVVMHYGGYPARLADITELCSRRGVALIEDACHAIGALYLDERQRPPHGAQSGTVGDIGCFSFFSNKNIAMGEGGLVVTRRPDLAERLRLLRSHGMTTLTWDRHRGHASTYDVVAHGYNYRLDELHAALGRCQLRKLPGNNVRRAALVAVYRQALSAFDGWIVPFATFAGESACHLSVVVAPDTPTRDDAVKHLKGAGVQTSLHYPCVAGFDAFRRFAAPSLDRSEAFTSRVITLPLFPTMTVDQVHEICRELALATGQETTSGSVGRG